MPLDASIPLSAKPVDATQLLSSVLNIGNQANQFKAGQISNESNQAILDEQNRLRALAQDPSILDANGNVDLQRFNERARAVAPTQGAAVSGGMANANTAVAGNQTAWYHLKGEQADRVRQMAGGLKDSPAFSQVDQSNPDAASHAQVEQLADLEDRLIQSGVPRAQVKAGLAPLYSLAAKNPGQTRTILENMTKGGMDSGSQVQAGTPNLTAVSTDKGTQFVNTNPNATSQPFGAVGNPFTPPNQFVSAPSGGTVRANAATGQTSEVGGGGGPVLNFPPGETAATQSQLQQERTAALQAVTQAGTTHDINRSIINEVDKGQLTGKAGAFVQHLQSLTGFQVDKGATDYNMLGKMLERQALAAAQSMGPHTNAGLEAAIRANGSLDYSPQAIRRIASLNDALTTGAQEYQRGLEASIARDPSKGVFAKRQFDQQWGSNFDPLAYRLLNAQDRGDKGEINDIFKEIGGPQSKQANNLRIKLQALKNLSTTGSL